MIVRSHRRLLLVLLLLAALTAAFVALPSQATTRSGHEFIYYNDAAHDTVVGVQVWCSNGSHSGWGQITPWYVIQPSGC